MQIETKEANERVSDRLLGFGCALFALAVNTLLLGLLAASFSQGPYFSHEQEAWYRHASIGFFLAGAIIPGIVLFFAARRSPGISIALTVWMFAVLIAAFCYAIMSSGGV